MSTRAHAGGAVIGPDRRATGCRGGAGRGVGGGADLLDRVETVVDDRLEDVVDGHGDGLEEGRGRSSVSIGAVTVLAVQQGDREFAAARPAA